MLEFTVTSAVNMLSGLKNWLNKAEEQLGAEQAEALLAARLAPDMFPLTTQIRFACGQAIEVVYRLQGRDLPPLSSDILAEARAGGEVSGTLADAKQRIDQSIAQIETALGEAPCLDGDAMIAHSLPMGLTFDCNAEQFLRDWALPQFYFHISMAYAILRANKVSIGKADYVAHMFAYFRQADAAGG